jgi:hypothetical protein
VEWPLALQKAVGKRLDGSEVSEIQHSKLHVGRFAGLAMDGVDSILALFWVAACQDDTSPMPSKFECRVVSDSPNSWA